MSRVNFRGNWIKLFIIKTLIILQATGFLLSSINGSIFDSSLFYFIIELVIKGAAVLTGIAILWLVHFGKKINKEHLIYKVIIFSNLICGISSILYGYFKEYDFIPYSLFNLGIVGLMI